jgi:hypothetical protein
MAMVLDELAQSGLARGPEWEATLQAHEGWLRDADNAAQLAWLRARLP